MNPLPKHDNVKALLIEVVSLIVSHPDDVQIAWMAVKNKNEVHWAMRGHDDDNGVLIGKGGSHILALQDLVHRLGEARQEVWTLRLVTPDGEAPPKGKPAKAVAIDPTPFAAVLTRIFICLGIDAQVHSEPGDKCEKIAHVNFGVAAPICTPELAEAEAHGNPCLIETLRLIFRLMSWKAGAHFTISVNARASTP